MRLDILETGHRLHISLALKFMRLVAGAEPDDVIKMSLYRPGIFGRAWMRLLRPIMRGPSAWTPGERELIAAFASRLNACPYCAGVHTGTATLALHAQVSLERLENWREGGFAPRIRAIFALMEKLAATPQSPEQTDIGEARQAGLTDEALREAFHVWFIFDLVNRLANALGFEVLEEEERVKSAAILHRIGYQVPGFLLR